MWGVVLLVRWRWLYGRVFYVSSDQTVNMFSSNLNKLAIIGRLLGTLPGRGVVCFNSANHIPCNAQDIRAVGGCTERSRRFLLGRSIGLVVTTYNAISSITNSATLRLPIPFFRIIARSTGTTIEIAGGKEVTIVKAGTAIGDHRRRGRVLELVPGTRILGRDYDLFIPLMRRN